MSTYHLPELGEGLSEGEIVAWKVNEGDSIETDQTMVEVLTDKATVEVPAPVGGTVKKLHYKPGDVAKVGAALIDIEEAGAAKKAQEKEGEEATETKVVKEPEETLQKEAESVEKQTTASSSGRVTSIDTARGSSRVLASPAVRKMARDQGLDLAAVQGSGERGRVLKKDLEAAQVAPASGGAKTEERIPFVGVRRKIAEQLSKSMYTAVHFTHHDEADFSEIMKLRKEANADAEKQGLDVRLTFLPFYIKAAIAGLRKFPILNSTLDESSGEIIVKHYYHFGISVQTDSGLMVAVVRDCDQKSVFQLAKELRDVAERARNGKASREDLTGSTITITNVGNIGGLHATPVINYPETVILGMYQIKKRPVVREINGEDQIVARPMMYTNITCDHRVIDGAIAAEFLRLVCDYLENPAKIALY